ncbi:cysteine hydrolase family protein [Nocardia jiangxiensis]|uniref:Cysteine hydrolase family protein n=1 Tax=Nocardia jiangxiensis TaxID=282685 RepID=A0ABW6SE06_9NOCA|nr:isochorismatase family cysteine hydrolase [Nocardia jiangxiensis]
MTDTSIVPQQTALMLMDYQPAALATVPDSDGVVERAQTALEWARERGIKVVFVRVAFAPEDYDAIPHHHKTFGPARRGRLFADGDPKLEIVSALDVRDDDIVVRKTRYGAFSTTNLHTLLGDSSIDTLVMGGISTAGVMLSTVREASDQDYRIFVLADATDDPDAEVHRVLIEKVFPRHADVITTSDLDTLAHTA